MRIRTLPILVAALAVLVTVPAIAAEPSPALIVDGFARAAVGGWGAPAPGLRWVPDGQPASFGVGRGQATIVLAEPGVTRAITQPGVTAGDVELSAQLSLDRLPEGGSVFVYLVGRQRDDAELRIKARIDESGAVFLQPTVADGDQEEGIGEEVAVPGLFVAAGQPIHLRAQVVGTVPTAIRIRAWQGGTPEPADWPVQATDTLARAKGPGHPGVRAYLGSNVTAVPLTLAVDDWSALVLDATVVDPTPSPTVTPDDPDLLRPDPVLAPGGVIARDGFARTSERAWVDAEAGGRWSHLGGGDDFRVVRGRGVASVPTGETRTSLLPVLQRDVLASATVRTAALPTGGNAWTYLVLRQGEAGEVRGRARIAPDGGVHLSISVVKDGEERQLGPEVRPGGLSTGPGAPVRLRFAGVTDATGRASTWKLKAWPATAAEPDGWTLQVRDDTPELQGAGAAGLRMYVGRSVTNGPVTLAVDDVLLLAADATTGEAVNPVIAGAGDIALCDSAGSARTASLLEGIAGTVMAVGDLVYKNGTAAQFRDCYEPTWGRFRDRTLPVLGNRDYGTPGAKGWFGYWGEQGAPPGGWQVIDLGAWRVYALNSQCDEVGCGPESAQVSWLVADLAANPRTCSMALLHEPRVSSGPHGDAAGVTAMWEALDAAGVELVVSGHDHGYERFLPVRPDGGLDTAGGIVQFVAGTGGGGGTSYAGRRAGSVVRDGETLGVLKLTLRPDGYDWRFLAVAGATFTDSGRAACH